MASAGMLPVRAVRKLGGVVRRKLASVLRRMRPDAQLPPAARAEVQQDRLGLPEHDPGPERVVEEAVQWLCRAQDQSRSQDGGAARHFSLCHGWSSSYPETTGYIVPTLLVYARQRRDEAVRQRARRMLDWLVSIQLPGGGFQGGLTDSQPVVPVTFNTGQVLLGLAGGVREWGNAYRGPMRRAADWLAATQDADGCWRKYPTPFAAPGEKVYETHVAWALLEAARVAPGGCYEDAAMANVRWALQFQRSNGWLENCCLEDASRPLTHTLGYALRGILEAYGFSKDASLLRAARKTADGLLTALRPDGFLPGRLDCHWQSRVRWACLTGTVQIAYCWLLLYQATGEKKYCSAAMLANRFVRRTVRLAGPAEARGAIKGSWPVDGEYGAYQYLNWACKFFIDANLLELSLADGRCRR